MPGDRDKRQLPCHQLVFPAISHCCLASAWSWPCPPPAVASMLLGCAAGMHITVGASPGAGGSRGTVLGEAVPPCPWPPQAWAAACHFLGGPWLRWRLCCSLAQQGAAVEAAAPSRASAASSGSTAAMGAPGAPAASATVSRPLQSPCIPWPCATLRLKPGAPHRGPNLAPHPPPGLTPAGTSALAKLCWAGISKSPPGSRAIAWCHGRHTPCRGSSSVLPGSRRKSG